CRRRQQQHHLPFSAAANVCGRWRCKKRNVHHHLHLHLHAAAGAVGVTRCCRSLRCFSGPSANACAFAVTPPPRAPGGRGCPTLTPMLLLLLLLLPSLNRMVERIQRTWRIWRTTLRMTLPREGVWGGCACPGTARAKGAHTTRWRATQPHAGK